MRRFEADSHPVALRPWTGTTGRAVAANGAVLSEGQASGLKWNRQAAWQATSSPRPCSQERGLADWRDLTRNLRIAFAKLDSVS
jgi:hypothetical protein